MKYLALTILLLSAVLGQAVTCRAVAPSGSGNGLSWSTPMAIPSTPTRGYVYYFADGNYSSTTVDNVSGTSIIEFRKAQSYDYGRSSDGCTNDISSGWNAGTMGSGQAKLGSQFTDGSSYFTLNGNGTQTTPGCGGAPGANEGANPPNPKDCGFKFDVQADSAGTAIGFSGQLVNITFAYVEIRGDATPSHNACFLIFGGTNENSTWTHIYGHNAVTQYFTYIFETNDVLSYSYFWGTQVEGVASDDDHGQFAYHAWTQSGTKVHHNIFRDITGTSTFTFGMTATVNSNWEFYDNIFVNTNTAPNGGDYGHLSDATIACINGNSCSGFKLYNNSFINLGGGSGIKVDAGTGATIKNNLWYTQSGGGVFLAGSEDHNSFLVTGGNCGNGTADVCQSSSSNPFTNYPGNVFTLASDNAYWNNRISIGSPYDTDMVGTAFTSSRGAYQYTTGSLSPPTNVSVIVF